MPHRLCVDQRPGFMMNRVLWSFLTVIILSSQTAGSAVLNQPDWDDAQGLNGWWEDVVSDVLIDETTGDIIVTGTYRYDLHVGPFSLTAQQHHVSGNTSDIFVARWSGDSWAWIATAGGPDNDWASSLTMTDEGALYVAGAFRSNISIFGTHQISNSDTTPRTLTTSPTSEAFLARIDPSTGDWVWASGFEGQAHSDWAVAIEPSPSGGVYVAGNYASNQLSHDGRPLMPGWGDGGMTDGFLAEFNSTGVLLAHASVFDPDSSLEVKDLSVTTEGLVLLAGHYIGQAAYAVPNKTVNTAPGYSEGFVAAWQPTNQTWIWMASIGGSGSDEIYSISPDDEGGAYVLSRSSSLDTYSIQPDNTSRISNPNSGLSGTTDVLVSRITGHGVWLWTSSAIGAGNDDAHSIATMEGGAVVSGGTASITMTFGSKGIQKSDDPLNMDLWIAGIGDTGIWQWALNAGMAKWPEATTLDHSSGVSVIGGSFSTPYVDFDDSRLWNWDNESTYQWPDAFFALLNHDVNQGCSDGNDELNNPECIDFNEVPSDQIDPDQDGSDDGIEDNGSSQDVSDNSELGVFGILVALLIAGMIIGIILISRSEDESSDK